MGVEPSPAGCRVLVLDDNRVACTVLATLLAEEGHVVETAHSGAEGLAKLETFAPAVALVDVVMPCMNGVEFVRNAREVRPELRCILMTGLDPRSPILEGMSYISKPVDFAGLLMMLDAR